MNDAQTMFTADHNFNVPALITIPSPINNDYRYLHARRPVCRSPRRKRPSPSSATSSPIPVRAANAPAARPISECVLPHLPFTTANLTEIAHGRRATTGILTVNTTQLLSNEPAQPYGGAYGRQIQRQREQRGNHAPLQFRAWG
jgi:hypothetical protein